MRCGFCGYEFDASDAQSSCGACPMAGGCHLVRCPRCGYEMPPEARLIRWLRGVRERLRAKRLAIALKESNARAQGSKDARIVQR